VTMAKKSHDLHGNAPDHSPIVLLLIDVINDFEFDEGAEGLIRYAIPAAQKIAALKQRSREAGVPAIYVNDNFGKWRSDFRTLIAKGESWKVHYADVLPEQQHGNLEAVVSR
jgi:nicotinamidase-related amidase